jgi:hypothetical protein
MRRPAWLPNEWKLPQSARTPNVTWVLTFSAAIKNTKITERFTLQFQADTYMVTNHADFIEPNTTFSFGVITGTDPRLIQLVF